MKKILILFVVFGAFAFSAIDECKTDVYFGNGILTDRETAKYNAFMVLKPAIIEKLESLKSFNSKIGKVDYVYNRTVSKKWDLFESFYQVVNLQGFVDWAANWLMDTKETIHSLDIEAQVDKYEASIRLGHKVLVVAHSQGNLFAQEAYETLGERSADHKKWLQRYWEVVSIASPDATTDIKPDMLPRIGWKNDMVAIIGGSNNNDCDARQVEWEFERDNIGSYPPVAKPKEIYVNEARVGTLYKHLWRATEGFKQKYLESNVHAFTFYMGKPLKDGDTETEEVFINPFTNQNLTDTTAKILIMDQIDKQLKKLEKLPSQWEINLNQKNCSGEITHISNDREMNNLLADEKVLPFNVVKGKVYKVKDTYVMASPGGTEIVEEINEQSIDYILEGTRDTFNTEVCTANMDTFSPRQRGAIEASVYWECKSDVNMTLLLTGGNVQQEEQDYAYVPNLSDISPNSSYNGYVSGAPTEDSCISDKYLKENPVSVYAKLKLLTKRELILRYEVNSTKGLDIGFYAGIDIFRTGYEVNSSVSDDHPVHHVSHTYGRWSGNPFVPPKCTNSVRIYSCACIPCTYVFRTNQSTVDYGPIAGATVKVIAASEYGRVAPKVLYSGETSHVEGKPYESGIIEFTEADYAKFDDDTYYVLSAKGGVDVDRDDNFEEDNESTSNHGTIHAIVKGSEFKSIPFGANVLTEAIYQTSGELLGEGYDAKKLEAKLNDAAKKLLKVKTFTIDNIFEINYGDVLLWSPTTDKEKLYRDYDTFVEPIVVKTYADEARIKESYTLIYERPLSEHPELAHTSLAITPSIEDNTTFGKVLVYNEGLHGIDHITLRGDESERFSINKEGLVSIVDASNLFIDTLYTLEMIAIDGEGVESEPVELLIHVVKDDIYDPSASVPQFQDAVLDPIPEDTVGGTVVGQVYFTDENSTIVDYFVSGQDKGSFEIDDNGEIKLRANAKIDYEYSHIYSIKVTALNIAGNQSLDVTLMFKIINVEDTPAYEPNYSVHLDENVGYKTIVGQLTQTREGNAPVTSFVLLNANVPFEIDTNGTIYVTGKIDYESKASYGLIAEARTAQGASNKIEIEIYVDDVEPETGRATLEALSLHVDENTPAWTEIGKIEIQEGDSPIENIRLYGTGHEHFSIDNNGTIRVASGATLDYEQDKFYALQVQATNAQGASDLVAVDIVVDNVADTLPTLGYVSYTVLLDASAGSIIGKIPLIDNGEGTILGYSLLVGDANGTFTIDNNGTLFLDEDVVLTEKSLGVYRLGIVLETTVGSVTQDIFVSIREEPLVDENASVPRLESVDLETIVENSSAGTVVGHVTFVDDNSSIVFYSLVKSDTFMIDNHGEIVLSGNTNIDFEPLNSDHTVSVWVTATNEAGNVSNRELLEFNIANVDDTPLFESTYDIHLLENAPIGTVLGHIVETRRGWSPIDSFIIDTYGLPFEINVDGLIRTTDYIDYEKKSSYDFRARAFTSHGESNKIKVHIDIDNIDPEVGQPRLEGTQIEIDENTVAGTIIGYVGVYEGDSPIESMVLSGQGTDKFRVTLNGTVVVAEGATINYEEKTSYSLQVQAYNIHGHSRYVPIDINITNLIDETGTILGATYEIDENASAETWVGQLFLEYQSEGVVLNYTLIGEGNGNFSIDDNGTIHVSNTAVLDYETKMMYRLQTKLESDIGESALASVRIVVNNIAETVPVLEELNISVEENLSIGTVIGKVKNISDDGLANAYTLDDNSTFHIDKNGSIMLHRTLDYETQSEYVLSVTASNAVGESVAVDVIVYIEDIDENIDTLKPVITLIEGRNIWVRIGQDYNEYRATALDDTDGDITESITIVSNVDTAVEGKYTVTYSVADEAGNRANDIIRTVYVYAKGECNASLSISREMLIMKINNGEDVTQVNTCAVMDMSFLFGGHPFNQAIGDWNVSNVTDMSGMFISSLFNQPIGNWDVSNVTDMSNMFASRSDTPNQFNQPLGDWNVSNVRDMSRMFEHSNFNQDISRWDVSNVTNMESMFYRASFNQALGDWNVSSVEDMTTMFLQSKFNQPLGDWNVSSVTDMSFMFRSSSFNQPLGEWDVSNVTNMIGMFMGDITFNQPLREWDVSKVTNMFRMFSYALSFNQAIWQWDVSNVSDHREFSENSLLEDSNNPFMEDVIKPVIVLYGDDNISILAGDDYIEAGAIATDNRDGNITENITIVSNVNTSIEGNYTVTYSVSDTVGNETVMIRIVRVKTWFKTVLHQCDISSVEFDNNFNRETGVYSGYINCSNKGLTDEDLKSFVILKSITGSLDLSGNALTTLNSLINLQNIGDTLDISRNANLDNISGLNSVKIPDISIMSIRRDRREYHPKIDGNASLCNPLIQVFDENDVLLMHGYVQMCTDTVAPEITLNGESPYLLRQHSPYVEDGASAYDGHEGNTTVVISGNVDSDTLGEYMIRYISTDSVGNSATITRIVKVESPEVYDPRAFRAVMHKCGIEDAEIDAHFDSATGVYDQSIWCGYRELSDYDLLGFGILKEVQGDFYLDNNQLNNVDGLNSLISVRGSLSLASNYLENIDGLHSLSRVYYTVDIFDNHTLMDISGLKNLEREENYQYVRIDIDQYTVKIEDNETLCEKRFSVVDSSFNEIPNGMLQLCNDTHAPTLILNGDNPTYVEKDNLYREQNVSTNDILDSNISVSIEGDIDTHTLGTQTLTYRAIDTSGNSASTIRTVIIEDREIHHFRNTLGKCGISAESVENNFDKDTGIYTGTINCESKWLTNEDLLGFRVLKQIVTGNLILSENNITNVAGLSSLERIEGYLDLSYTPQLLSLTGLENLIYLKGFLNVTHSPNLTDISAVSNATQAYNYYSVYIDDSQYTVKADGNASFCQSIARVRNENAENVSKLQVCKDTQAPSIILQGDNPLIIGTGSVYEEAGVITSDVLDENITVTIEGDVDTSTLGTYTLIYTATDTSGNHASTIRTVKVEDVNVHQFRSTLRNKCSINTATFDANFNPLTGFYNETIWCDGRGLTDVDLDTFTVLKETGHDIYINNNTLTHLNGLANLVTIGSGLYAYDNPLENIIGLSNLEGVGTNISLFRTNLTNLDGLEKLVNLGDGLYVYDSQLQNVDALANLESIGTNLSLAKNSLTNVNGLDHLTHVGENIWMWGNQLIDISGLHGITEVKNLELQGNLLNNLHGLENLTRVREGLYLHDNQLENIDELGQLESIGTNLSLGGNQITNLSGLSALTHVGHGIYLWNNQLTNLDGLQGITHVDYSIDVNHNVLGNVDGLTNLVSVGDGLYLHHNQLENVDGLSSLESVGGHLWLLENNLTNVDGLSSLTSVGYTLSLRKNLNLSDISGLANLQGKEGQQIEIDLDQYMIKVDYNEAFCSKIWNIWDADLVDIVDDMGLVCE